MQKAAASGGSDVMAVQQAIDLACIAGGKETDPNTRLRSPRSATSNSPRTLRPFWLNCKAPLLPKLR